ncbi:MAG: baseplate J/gp47 family protein [Cytophagales bacterium]|nr:baseplate J/gp47 family protein [Cytophagales bacterium]
MAKTCFENPIIRDGVSQQQRLTKALLPEYVAVDERKIEELKTFVLEFSRELHFYDNNNETSGDWSGFFDQQVSQDQRTEPHFALFQAFLELFSIAQGDLNTLTARHLDFYYKDVLRLKENPPVPDQVFIILELAKHVANTGHVIKEGTRFKAGKDEIGSNIFYTAQSEIGVNKATVGEIKSIYRDPETKLLHQSDMSNSEDGLGAEILNDASSWYPFGNVTRKQSEIGFAFASPILNLAEGIRRITVKLTFKEFNDEQLTAFSNLHPLMLNNALNFYFSGEEEWIGPSEMDEAILQSEEYLAMAEEAAIEWLNGVQTWQEITGDVVDSPYTGYGDQVNDYGIGKKSAKDILEKRAELTDQKFTSLTEVRAVEGVGVDKINDILYTFGAAYRYNNILISVSKKELIITRTIGKDKPAIVPYNQEVLVDPLDTNQPAMKVVLDTSKVNPGSAEHEPYIYESLEHLEIQQIDLEVDVREVGTLVVQNDRTVMDPSKNMAPFGITPVLGSTFYIGNHEVFQKQLTRLDINLEWFGIPESDFASYYQYYDISVDQHDGSNPISASNLGRDNAAFRANIDLLDRRKWNALAKEEYLFDATGPVSDPVPNLHQIRIENTELASVNRDWELSPSDNFNTETQKGFLRLELAKHDFGHKDYQIAFTHQILAGVKNNAIAKIPNQPYNPTLKTVSLNYKSSVCFNCTEQASSEIEVPEKFFHLHPFGATEQVASGNANEPYYFLPQYPNEGELYIGLDNLLPAQNLSILMQVLEGSEDADTTRPDVSWSYLSDNQWQPFKSLDILSDTTNGLLTSGIIDFSFYKTTTNTDSLLTTGKHWIRATVPDGYKAIPEFVNIITQAVVAQFEDNENDPNYLSKALTAETVSKLEFSDSSIRGIEQPFASVGGAVREESTAFYTRVSERLRHKQRAITIWDYERLILQAFPSVYKVKCLNHTRYSGKVTSYNQLTPGHVSIIVVSNVQNKNAINPITPRTSLNRLEEIKAYLDAYRTEPIELHVHNPVYEKITVDFKVKFRRGYDKGFYERQLEDEIKAFLSPWAYDQPDISFGGRIHQSRIIDFIDEREYVDFVTCFKMFHSIQPSDGTDPEHMIEMELTTEAIASTSASILSSAGGINEYGNHKITVLSDHDNCGDCDDNLIDPPPPVLSADSCCDETDISVGNKDDPYSYSVPDMRAFPVPPQTELCPPIPEPAPVASMPRVVIHDVTNAQFNVQRQRSVYLLKGDHTFFVPMNFQFSLSATVVEVPDANSIILEGNHTEEGWLLLENLSDITNNPSFYRIARWPVVKRPGFDGKNTRLTLIKPHKIQVGDQVNLFKRTGRRIRQVFLPKVTSEMVFNKTRINLQLILNVGHTLRVRPANHAGIDRLQLKGSENTIDRFIVLRSGLGFDRYSIQVEATAFDPLPRFNDLGWRVLMENENYFIGPGDSSEEILVDL